MTERDVKRIRRATVAVITPLLKNQQITPEQVAETIRRNRDSLAEEGVAFEECWASGRRLIRLVFLEDGYPEQIGIRVVAFRRHRDWLCRQRMREQRRKEWPRKTSRGRKDRVRVSGVAA